METQPPPQKGASTSVFCQRLLWPNGCMDQDATWYGGRFQPTRHCVRWGPSSPPLKGHSPQFSANVRCGHTAGWTKMPLGMEVGLGPGDCVRWGHSYPQEKGHTHSTQFLAHVYCGQTAGWMKIEDATWYGSRPRPRPHCIRRGPSSPQKGHSIPPLFGPCLLWPRSPISASAELLSLHAFF